VPIPTIPVSRTPLHGDVFDAVLEQIVRGDLREGDLIDDGDVAERLGVSRAPVRLALDLLAEVGLVTVAPRQFTAVAAISLMRVRESIEVLVAVSGAVMRQVVGQLTDADRTRLERYRREVLDARTAVMRAAVRDYSWDAQVVAPLSVSLGNRELVRARSWVVPYIRWASHRYFDVIDAERERRVQRQVVDALLVGDAAEVELAWQAYGVSLLGQTADVDIAAARGIDRSMRSLRRPLLRDGAVDQIQAAILDGTLIPGEVLTETALRTWLRLSRTPVRAALTRLAELGLVELEPARKARVMSFDPVSVRDTMGTLGVLRVAALRAAFTSDLASLVERVVGLERQLDEGGDIGALGIELMGAIDLAGANSVEEAIASRFDVRAQWFSRRGWLGGGDRVASQLRAIVAAVRDGDLARACEAVLDYYELDPDDLTGA